MARGGTPAALALGTLLGPTTDNQLPITVSLTHAGFKIDEFSLFLQDSSGNFFLIGDDKLVKYSPAFAALWSYSLTNTAGLLINSQTLSVAPDGGIYFGGYINAALPGETFAGETDAVIGKITSAGTLAWIHQWGSSSNDATTRTAVEPDGSVIAHGTSSVRRQETRRRSLVDHGWLVIRLLARARGSSSTALMLASQC